MGGRSFCVLAAGSVGCVQASIKYFRDEYLEHIRGKAKASQGAH